MVMAMDVVIIIVIVIIMVIVIVIVNWSIFISRINQLDFIVSSKAYIGEIYSENFIL